MSSVKRCSLFLMVLTLVLAACAPMPPSPTARPTAKPGTDQTLLIASRAREANPQVSETDLQALVSGNTTFALDLYRTLSRDGGNLVFSPYSISLALAMTYAGARGETAAEMARVLHFDLPAERLHPAFNALDQRLQREPTGESKEGTPFRLHLANSLWGQKDFAFLPEFLDLLAANYGAGMHLVDFGQPESARQQINAWVEEHTEKKIRDLIPPGVLDALTRLVLVNAIYFNAAWATPFDADRTQPAPFTLADGSQVEVPTMHQEESLLYAESEDYQAVLLPYQDSSCAMLILLPRAGHFDAVEQQLDAATLQSILTAMRPAQVNLSLPKFKIESAFALVEKLRALGLRTATSPEEADFSGMTGERALYIGEVLHKAYLSVDEKGTEAAAATAVVMKVTGMPGQPVEMKVDHPFLVGILDRETHTLLFFGRVMDPR